MNEKYNVAVIGGGPAGYVAAIKAAQEGMKTICIEKRNNFGGTCLNVGCIPSKTLLHVSHEYEKMSRDNDSLGLFCKEVSYDFNKVMAFKNKVISENATGIEYLFKKNKVATVNAEAKIKSAHVISLSNGTEIAADNIIIATGSKITELPHIKTDGKYIINSDHALSMKEVPDNMVIVGGGYIGLEMASIFNRFGCNVTVIEFAKTAAPAMDHEISKELQKELCSQGIKFMTSSKITNAEVVNNKVICTIEDNNSKQQHNISSDVLLISVGRKPNTDNLGITDLGINTNKFGAIEVDSNWSTKLKNIYAIGDVIPGPMLAHKGEEEAVAVVDIIAGKKAHINYNCIPGIVYTSPEAAFVGKTEQELQDQGMKYKIGKFNFKANGRAKATNCAQGFVKILVDSTTGRILGAHMLGPDVGTIIAELVFAMEYNASAEDIARVCHAHPTLNEAVKEAALIAWLGKAIHS